MIIAGVLISCITHLSHIPTSLDEYQVSMEATKIELDWNQYKTGLRTIITFLDLAPQLKLKSKCLDKRVTFKRDLN